MSPKLLVWSTSKWKKKLQHFLKYFGCFIASLSVSIATRNFLLFVFFSLSLFLSSWLGFILDWMTISQVLLTANRSSSLLLVPFLSMNFSQLLLNFCLVVKYIIESGMVKYLRRLLIGVVNSWLYSLTSFFSLLFG